jgi:hypothetical protein
VRYRRKPVIIEALRFTSGLSVDEMRTEWGAPFMLVARYDFPANELIIRTLEGDKRAQLGDFVIKSTRGEFYPCEPDVFAMEYEPI